MSAIIINQNTPPANITFKQTVSFSTIDQNNNNAPLAEAYTVSGPMVQGVTPIYIAGGTKAVIPLTTSSGNGAPYLKVHFPTIQNGNNLYITYCVAANNMADGYYDYKTGVPTTYYNALKAWIGGVPSSSLGSSVSKKRILKFSAYGNSTNKPANAVTFYVNFQATFSNLVLQNTQQSS